MGNHDERQWRGEWTLPDDVTYLNHGSFGPSPRSVQHARRQWSEKLEGQPMDFFVRQLEGHRADARARIGEFVGADPRNLVFVDNATSGMNIVARSMDLQAGDEVLLTDHEYGAVMRIWQSVCRPVGARVFVKSLPSPVRSAGALVDAVLEGVTQDTRLIVVSHVTSATALIFPVEEVCRRAGERGVPVCIDGPHAVAMLPLQLERIGCDFYTASCHKWLSAPFGSGFLWVSPKRHGRMQPAIRSWGRGEAGAVSDWRDEFNWSGTRDPAAFFSIPAAIEFLQSVGLETFRERTHELARYARTRITELTGLEPLVPDERDWYGPMTALPLPATGEAPPEPPSPDPLQNALWERYRIEVLVSHWNENRLLRVSCHLYNSKADIDRLVEALGALLELERNSSK